MNITGLLIRREFVERVRQKSFIWGTLLGCVGIILLALLPLALASLVKSNAITVAVLAPDPTVAGAMVDALSHTNFVPHVVSMRMKRPELPPQVRKELDKGRYDAAVVAYRNRGQYLGFTYYPKSSPALQSSSDLQTALQRAVLVAGIPPSQRTIVDKAIHFPWDVQSLNKRFKNENDQFFSIGMVYFLLIILYIAVIVYGQSVAQGVVEEKANRVMEVMIGAVRPSQLLAGKIFGISAVALLQLTINALSAAVAAIIAGILYGSSSAGQMGRVEAASSPQTQAMMNQVLSQGLPHVPWITLGFLILFFFLGFFSYSAIYAGIGSLLSKPEEIQQYSVVFMLPVMAAYVLAIFALQEPDLPLVVWGSMIPLMSPLLMFTRISTTDVPAWQIAVSIGGSLVAIWALTILAGKLYRVGVLMYGKPPRPAEIWRALRAHT
jgi:ABC-2 type transport system permease protein